MLAFWVTTALVLPAAVPNPCCVKFVWAVIVGVVIVQLALTFQIVQLLLVALILLTVFLFKFQVRTLEFNA